jgi:hypothetical protein
MIVHDYFDIDHVASSEEMVQCLFNTPSFMLGKHIRSRGSDGEPVQGGDIPAGAVADVPIWAARTLRSSGFASVSIPKMFHTTAFREFKVDPLVANVRSKSPFFYESGLSVASMAASLREASVLRNQLQSLFQLRFFGVMLAALKRGIDVAETRDALGEAERMLLDSVREDLVSYLAWKRSVL